MNGKRPLPKKKLAMTAILGAFVVSGVFGFAFPFGPMTAEAVIPVVDAPVFGTTATIAGVEVSGRTLSSIWTALKVTGVLALKNAARYFANKIAYDAANYIASGGSGQKPFFTTTGLGSYLQDTALDAAGEALGTLSEAGFESIGINLCSPSDPRLALNIKLGKLGDLPGELGIPLGPSQPQPRCSWRAIRDSWTEFAGQATDQVLDQVGVMFQTGQNELSTALEFNSYVTDQVRKKLEQANTDYAANAGFRPLKSKIGGYVLTPADVIRTEQQSIRDAQKAQEQDQTLVAAGLDDGGVTGILGSALQTFVSTLGEKMMKKIFEKGLILLSQAEVETRDLYGSFTASPPAGGRAAAELANASLLTVRILSTTNFDELTDFATCPPASKGPSNCVIDSQFFTAVTRSTQEAPLTVRQAIDQGLLRGDWKLLSPGHPKNRDKNCYLEAYCYSNLVKLRRARIIPIGWELAANSKLNDPSKPITLRQAMDRFNDCPVDEFGRFDPSKLPDPNKPWCHLIDPDWVLKYPKTICRQQAFGPTLINPQVAGRAQTCVDAASCIAEDASGDCVGGYGYCLREKNLWRLDADACPAQYASCQSLRRADGEHVSYLMNTIERAGCNAENAGCRAYSTARNAVPNPGFEDAVQAGGLRARDWQYDDVAAFNHSGDRSLQGVGAVAVRSGKPAASRIVSLLPGSEYELSAAALQESEESGPFAAAVTMTFKDREDDPADAVGDDTTCAVNSDGSVSFDVAVTALGYVSAGCKVTTPANAVAAVIRLESDAPASNPVWFDQVGMFGSSYSASPLDQLHFNAKAEACPSNQTGCSEFIPLEGGSLNLVRNPGFEEQNAADDAPKFWTMAAKNYDKQVSEGSEGFSSIRLSSKLDEEAEQIVNGLISDASYVFSIDAEASGSLETAPRGRVQLVVYDAAGNPLDKADQPDCSPDDDSGLDLMLEPDAEYRRSECQFVTSGGADHLKIVLDSVGVDAEPIRVDAVQLELAVRPSGFHAGHSSTSVARLRKAPEGLNCAGLPGDPPACAGYAPACRREEAGCNLYKPADGGTSVPAVISPSDACPAACAGYDAFRQEPTNFTGSKFPLFLIPSTARACSALEAGCEEFTNLERLARGGESREAYSYLRLCQKPDEATGTFYTWEGNDVQGYQLRVWTLRNSNVVSEPSGTSGSDPTGGTAPCTALGYDATGRPVCRDDAGPEAPGACKKSDVFFNPDCREFYDVNGNIHYRLYSKTIVASDACVEYRMSRSEETDCRAYGGSWVNNECHFFGLPNESASCRLEAAGCRAYTGNAARNIRVAVDDTFESGTTDGWFQFADKIPDPFVANSNESVNVGGHSLKVTTTQATKDVSDAIRKDRAYLLTFWAKGNGDLTPKFSKAAGDQTFQRVSLTTEWRPYTVGPVRAVNDPSRDFADPFNNEQLVFEYQGTAVEPTFFLDNVVLKEIAQSLYLINGSWVTPAQCDRAPNGAVSPQYMLGCQEYSDKDNKKTYLKSFDRLCREQAVGCRAFYDTQNTPSPFAQTFNAVCTLTESGAPKACVPEAGSVTCPCGVIEDGRSVQACLVTKGETTCRYNADHDAGNKLADDAPYDGHIGADGDTVRVKADALAYLIDRPEFRCDAANVGCAEVGEPTMEREGVLVESWSARYLKNNPAQYADTLCLRPEVSCQAYKRTDNGALLFFKDPGKHACEFRSNVTVSGFSTSGWYRKGADEPCYPDFLEAGVNYGIWKNSDELYQGWVGECPAQFNQCKEFVDPQDTSVDHPAGQPYYAILNDRLDAKTCQNRVSLTKAPSQANDASSCVLFRQTDNLELKYGSVLTYADSEAKRGELVDPVNSASSTAPNDANLVIRVKRDRQCGEWLDCRSSETVWNESAGQYQNVCTAYAVCERFEKVGDTTRCAEYVDSGVSGQVLTDQQYQTRDTGWKGQEFSGYSIPNQYPVHELVTVDISADEDSPDLRLAYSLGKGPCEGKTFGQACGSVNTFDNAGTCLGPAVNLKCVYPIDGSRGLQTAYQQRQRYTLNAYPAASCRAYPQEDSPFPSNVADPAGWDALAAELNGGNPVLVKPAPAFTGANVCQRRLVNGVETSSCECNYQIAAYGGRAGTKKYFPVEMSDLPAGYCQGGKYEDYECDPAASGVRSKNNLSCCAAVEQIGEEFGAAAELPCSDGATCQPLSKIDRVVGYQGQCLERDLATPINNQPDQYACATWRPVGMVGGTRDIYNLHQTAGYFAPPDRKFYCAGEKDRWMINLGINATADTNGDGMIDPFDQPTMKFFGPGKVNTSVTNFSSHGAGGLPGNCSNAADTLGPGYGWCIYPGISQLVGGSEGGEIDPATVGYGLSGDAIGILGCYEVSDSSKGLPPATIEYPYIGPPIYRDQLEGMFFHVADDIYYYDDGDGNDGGSYTDDNTGAKIPWTGTPPYATFPTNPYQYVLQDCNDDGDDSIDSTADDDDDHLATGSLPITDGDSSKTGFQFGHGDNGVYYIYDGNNWLVDPSDGEGMIQLELKFDSTGKISKLILRASDSSDEGTFGILDMGFVFKPGCDKVVGVDQPNEFGLTQGITDVINSYRDFAGNGPYQITVPEQACRPWGAIGSVTALPSQAPWTYVTRQVERDASLQPIVNQCTTNSFRTASQYEDSFSASLPSLTVRNLFRKVYGAWRYRELFNDTLKQEELYASSTDDVYDDTGKVIADIPVPVADTDIAPLGLIPFVPPRVASVADAKCDANGRCPAGKLATISINGRDEGVISGQNGVLPVTARFYAWASHNAMPIVLRLMLWGDYSPKEPPAKGWYKNQKPYCSADTSDSGAVGECDGYKGLTCRNDGDCPAGSACGPERYCANAPSKSCTNDADCTAEDGQCINRNHFGNTPGACFAAPYEFQHVYTCNIKDLSAMPACDTDGATPSTAYPCRRQIGGAWTCVYRPAAQIVDNWGWCNCTGSDCKNGGVHGEGCDPAQATSTKQPWSSFSGEVRLAPTTADRLKFEQLLIGGLPSKPLGGGFFYELYETFGKFYKPVKFFFGGFKGGGGGPPPIIPPLPPTL